MANLSMNPLLYVSEHHIHISICISYLLIRIDVYYYFDFGIKFDPIHD